jgi:hypothetical protein
MESRSHERIRIAAVLFLLAACQMKSSRNPDPAVTGTVQKVLPSLESAFYATVVIEMRNGTPRPVSITRYRLEWPGGLYVGTTESLELAAGASRGWRVRVPPSSGDLKALLEKPESARVIILETRP